MVGGMTRRSGELLTSLQAGRAGAALAVAFYHASLYIFALKKYWGYDPTYNFFEFGHAGVEFFFVLSGFIIFYIHQPDLGRPLRLFPYLRKRFLRIYPIYWIVLAGVIAVYFTVPSFGYPYHREAGTILSSILLVHVNGNANTDLAVAWTLYHEIAFYAVFALAIFNKRFGLAAIAVWMLVSAATLIIEPQVYSVAFFFSPLQLLFGMGMLSCWIVNGCRVPMPGWLTWSGVALFAAAAMEDDYLSWLTEMDRALVYGFASALIVTGIVTLERQGRLKVPAVLVLMGNASYIIYLIHFTLLSGLAKLFMVAGAKEALPALLSFFLLVALAILLGIAAHVWVERPLLRFLNALWRSRDRKVEAEAPAEQPDRIAA